MSKRKAEDLEPPNKTQNAPQSIDGVLKTLRKKMQELYGVDEDLVRVIRSPYRIAPLGAHIDHQQGPVMGMAIDRATFLAYVPSGSAGRESKQVGSFCPREPCTSNLY